MIYRFLAIVIIVQLFRLFVLLNAQIDFYSDEVYYWYWSKHLDFGYYSKPPMIAWIIALFTSICGDGFLCIKLPSLLLYPITSLFIYAIAKELFDEKIAFYSGVAFITLPAVSMSSLIISTDVLLLLFWSMSLYFFIKAIRTDRWIFWIAAAVAAGAGLLTKYTMIIFIFSVFFYLALSNKHRHHLKNPKLYITALLTALIYLPNLYWNYQHDFITFLHTKNISKIEEHSHFHPQRLLEFWGAQLIVFGPIFFLLLFAKLFKVPKEEPLRLLYAFVLPFFIIISLQALLSRALANWAAPTYVAATIFVIALYWQKKWLIKLAIALNLALMLIAYNYYHLLDLINIQPTAKIDPLKRVKGFSDLAKQLNQVIKRYPKTKLLFDNRTIMAEMIYYLKPHPFDAVMFNPSQKIHNQFDISTDLSKHIGEDFLYITQHPQKGMERYFKRIEPLGSVEVILYPDFKRKLYIYYLHHFKGYQ